MTILIANSNADPFNQALVEALGPLAQPVALPYGDAVFVGLWEGGRAVRVLVERKRTLDFIASILNGHHIKQVQDAAQAGFDFIYLFVEGYFTSDDEGMVVIPRHGKWIRLNEIPTETGHLPDLEYRRLDSYLNQLDLYMGVRYRITRNVHDTAHQLTGLYELFQKPPNEHHTLQNAYLKAATNCGQGLLIPPTLLEKVAMQLPGVGWSRARALAEQFGTLQALCEAIAFGDAGALCEAEGVGKGIAQKILDEAKEIN